MKSRTSGFIGVLFVGLGIFLLLREYFDLRFFTLRGYGLLFIGLLGFFASVNKKPPRGIYIFSFLTLMGLYYAAGDWGIYQIDRGLTLSVVTLAVGVSFYPLFWFGKHSWNHLLAGNLITLVGLIFLAYYNDFIPNRLFVTLVDDYWPVLLILLGMGFLFNALVQQKHQTMPNDTHKIDETH